jgi:hypothetical protein
VKKEEEEQISQVNVYKNQRPPFFFPLSESFYRDWLMERQEVIMLVLIKYLFSLEFGGERKRGLQISRLALCISNFGSRERLDCAVLRTSLLLDKEQSF